MKTLQNVVLLFIVNNQLIDGFSIGSTHNVVASTKNHNEDCNRLPGPTIREVVRHSGPTIELTEQQLRVMHDRRGGRVDRRAFFVSVVVGAASILAVTEDAAAMTNHSQEPMKPEPASTVDILSTTALVTSSATLPAVAAIDTRAIIERAAKKAMSGGKAGAAAAVVQVFSLMWLRTTMNYQYRFGEQSCRYLTVTHYQVIMMRIWLPFLSNICLFIFVGGTLSSSLKELYDEGGIPRLYQGLPFALLQV